MITWDEIKVRYDFKKTSHGISGQDGHGFGGPSFILVAHLELFFLYFSDLYNAGGDRVYRYLIPHLDPIFPNTHFNFSLDI